MGAPQPKQPSIPADPVARCGTPRRPVDTTSISSRSPPHDLQLSLELAFAPEPEVERYPGAVRLVVLAVSIVAPWTAILMAARQLLR